MIGLVSADFARRQDRYRAARSFMRDVLIRGIAFRILAHVSVEGLDSIPPSGPTILMINHIAAIDPVVVMGVVRPRFVVPMSKIENFRIPLVGLGMRLWGMYSVQRGAVDRTALQNTVELLKGGNLVLISPEGHRQPALGRGKDGLVYTALKAEATIVPCGVDGTRDFPKTLLKLRPTPICVRIGRAFRLRGSDHNHVPRAEISRMTQEAMYQLATLLPEHRRGTYSDLSQMTTDRIEFV
ncbi:MAG TPA: lysophospholipid acyltransferase family protein [Aggregatilineales bacterium]|nr:lysophospholipid acyltransferase family protein [Aggregatilineales bacterium]